MKEEEIEGMRTNKVKVLEILSVVLLFILFSITSFSQEQIDFEQIAFNYFVDSILPQEDFITTKVLFDGKIELQYTSFREPYSCFKDKELYIALKAKEESEVPSCKNEIHWIKTKDNKKIIFRKKKKLQKKNYIMLLFSSTPYNSKHYVLIKLDRLSDNIDYYFEIDKSGKVDRWCQTGRL